MERDPIKISWDDLNSKVVEDRLREQATIGSTKSHYEKANVVAPTIAPPRGLRALMLVAAVYLAVFGFCGGILGWGVAEILNLRPDRQEEARQLIFDYESINRAQQIGRFTQTDADRARKRLAQIGSDNPYFVNHIDAAADPATRQAREREARRADRAEAFRADALLFGVSGLFIAMALASAERIVERDWRGATVHAMVGAMLGLVGGVAVALVSDSIDYALLGDVAEQSSLLLRMTSRAIGWMLLGGFLGVAPGVALRSPRRALLGVLGGLAGGLLGGLLFDPVSALVGSPQLSRLVGLLAIGALAGAAMGWIEDVAKQGWLRVAEGLIAGKQFILYRNPTFVGSAPMSHIYLFRDALVGRRHAAIYHVNKGFEIENLPLGTATFVNDEPVTRRRLRGGDRIRIGKTTFLFEEKHPS